MKKKFTRHEILSRHAGGLDRYLSEICGEEFANYRKTWNKNKKSMTHVSDFPQYLLIESDNRCNLTCRMCFRSNNALKEKIEYPDTLPLEIFCKAVDECIEHNCPSICLNLNNEPLLNPSIAERISYAVEKGIKDVFMHTNGILLNEKIAVQLIESGLTRLSISIDAASGRVYKKIRGSNANYHKLMKNIHGFLKLRKKMGRKLPVLRVTFVSTSINIQERDMFIRMWIDSVDEIAIQRYAAPEETEHYLKLYHEHREHQEFNCYQPFERMVLKGDGSVSPCCKQFHRTPVGNIYEKTLYDIWNGSRMREFRRIARMKDWSANIDCKECNLFR